ncbi:MAG TPA: DNA-directed RNA polymerase subunit beta, partial [Spirochaetota bacterium]|nr:DNA-directed RNA polymerase subunit beta [Spirochaetota bacterium]
MKIGKPKRELKNSRVLIGSAKKIEVEDMPNLIQIQISSYDWFLQRKRKANNEPVLKQGLQSLFEEIFPIISSDEKMSLEFVEYTLGENDIKYDEFTAKQKGQSYSIPVKALINLKIHDTGEIRQKEIYLGEFPLMTDRGTFIINGAERVVVSQIHRSPGVVYSLDDKTRIFNARIIPYRGSWLEFEIEEKKGLLFVRIDRKRKILVTTFLRVLGYDTREKIIELFYKDKVVKIETQEQQEDVARKVISKDVYIQSEGGDQKEKIVQAGTRLTPIEIDKLVQSKITEISVIDFDNEESTHIPIIISCLEKEDVAVTKDEPFKDEPTKFDAINKIYSVLKPGEPTTAENAEKEIRNMFFSEKRYDLGAVGRYKINKKFGFDLNITDCAL